MPLLKYNNRNLFFVHIPKTGGSSLYLSGNTVKPGVSAELFATSGSSPCTPQHYHIKLLNEKFPSYKKNNPFTIIRDPWSRTCSEYAWQLCRENLPISWNQFESWLNAMLERYSIDPYIADNHIRPQCHFTNNTVKIFTQNKYSQCEEYVKNFFGSNYDCSVKEKQLSYDKPDINEINKLLVDKWHNIYKKDKDLYEKLS